MRSVVLLIMAGVAASGCLTTTFEADIDLSGYEEAERLTYSLDNMTSDAMWIEVVPKQTGTLRVQVDRVFAISAGQGAGDQSVEDGTPDVCSWIHADVSASANLVLQLGSYVAVAQQGRDETIRFDTEDGRIDDTIVVEQTVFAGQPYPVLVALSDVAFWKEHDARYDVIIDAPGGMHHRRLADPAFTCVTRPSDYQGGSYVDSGTLRSMSDQHVLLPVHGHARSLFMVSADAGFSYQLRDQDGALLNEGEHPIEDPGMVYQWFASELSMGTYRFQVDELEGSNTPAWYTVAAALVLDLPLDSDAAAY